MRWSRRGAVGVFVSALLPVIGGVAVANPLSQEKDTDDGYHLKLSIDDVVIQSVPNMAGAPLVREGFVTATSTLAISCTAEKPKCTDVPVTAELAMNAEIGCPLDLSSGVTTGLNPQVTGSLPVGQIIGSIFPPPTPAPDPSPNGVTDILLRPLGQISPQANVNLKPGSIRDVRLGTMKFPVGNNDIYAQLDKSFLLAGEAAALLNPAPVPQQQQPPFSDVTKDVTKRAAGVFDKAVLGKPGDKPLAVSVQNFHVVVDSHDNTLNICGGVVAIRVYAQGKVQTPNAIDTVDMYGDLFTL